jgi:hypothetical protein
LWLCYHAWQKTCYCADIILDHSDGKCNHKCPYKREVGDNKEGDVMTEAVVGYKEGALSQELQAVSRSYKRQINRFSPRASRRNENLLLP